MPTKNKITKKLTETQVSSKILLNPSVASVSVMNAFRGDLSVDGLDFEVAIDILKKSVEEVQSGNHMRILEMLIGQACALESMFVHLSTEAKLHEYSPLCQGLMQMALKAQNQSRATLQAAISLVQPNQVAFVKQANISQGNQQVNNFVSPTTMPQNELLD